MLVPPLLPLAPPELDVPDEPELELPEPLDELLPPSLEPDEPDELLQATAAETTPNTTTAPNVFIRSPPGMPMFNELRFGRPRAGRQRTHDSPL